MGLDLVCISNFASLLQVEGSAFEEDSFTDAERNYAKDAHGEDAQHLAARWAAKEACLKAMDQAAAALQVEPPRIAMRDIEVIRDHRGRPSLALHGKADALATSIQADRVLLTLSHDGDHAIAAVIFERVMVAGP
jgi:holo-[acyl-carrier protein] synthase